MRKVKKSTKGERKMERMARAVAVAVIAATNICISTISLYGYATGQIKPTVGNAVMAEVKLILMFIAWTLAAIRVDL